MLGKLLACAGQRRKRQGRYRRDGILVCAPTTWDAVDMDSLLKGRTHVLDRGYEIHSQLCIPRETVSSPLPNPSACTTPNPSYDDAADSIL